jgi:hypothetical protein
MASLQSLVTPEVQLVSENRLSHKLFPLKGIKREPWSLTAPALSY